MLSTNGALGGGSYDVRPTMLCRTGGGGGLLCHMAIITVRDDARNARQPLVQRLAAALNHITHPNVERLLQTDHPEQRGFCVVTPWSDGGDLRAYLLANPMAQVLDIACTIAGVLQYLHSCMPCVVHGNLDLSSIMMHGGTPRLWDFSLCRLDPAPATGPLADAPPDADAGPEGRNGVLTAMAPELYSTGLVTTASDVYAFGILLFELFARRPPFPSLRRLGAAVLLYQGKRPSRHEIPPDPRSDAVWSIITRCWAQDPSVRPTMAQVEADLHLVPEQ